VSHWPSSKANRVLAALLRIGWRIKRQKGSHRTMSKEGCEDYTFAYGDDDELGPKILSKIAKKTGLTPDDL
jgi:predicted RNA binding protein YcfA (HicA-like mRNA interferase family)